MGDLCRGGSGVSGVCYDDAECAPSGDACVDNQYRCGSPACDGSTPDCRGSPGARIDTPTGANNCGRCGNACPAGQTCKGGACGFVCGGDFCPPATTVRQQDGKTDVLDGPYADTKEQFAGYFIHHRPGPR